MDVGKKEEKSGRCGGGKAFKQYWEGDWASAAGTEPMKFNYSDTKSNEF